MPKNQIIVKNNSIKNLYMNSNVEPLENVTINWLSGSSIFKGREDTLTKMKELFETKERVVLHGAPGIGKTETARHFAENYSEDFKGNLIWVYAETPQNIKKSFKQLTAALELQTTDVSQAYSKFRNSKCLIIFDNTENMEAISRFLPSTQLYPTIRILITSQFGEWDASVEKIRIDTLNPEDAVDIIREKIGDKYNEIPQNDWFKIVQHVECIPLSVQIVSSLLYEKFREILIKNFDLDAFLNDLMDGTFINENIPLTEQNLYNKTVLISIYSALNRLQMKEAFDLLCFVAYWDADHIFHDDFLFFERNEILQKALNKLKDYSLIQFDFQEKDYKIKVHRTIQLVLRKHDLYKQNGNMFKALLKKMFIENKLFFYMFSISEYTKKEEFQEKAIEFYDENPNDIDLFLCFLAKYHCDKILQILLRKFKNKFYETDKYNKILNKMLFEAISRKNTDIHTIDVLINYGAKITYSPENNWTNNGFHEASDWLSIELFDRLLKLNDSKNIINSKDYQGQTILHLLVKESNKNYISKTIDCMDHLISKWRADISIQDNDLENILHLACQNKNICLEVIKYLVEKSNDKNLVNAQNKFGDTPLHLLFRDNYDNSDLFKIVSYLINECEVDITIQAKYGRNILFYVCRYGTSKIIELVLSSINCREIINNKDDYGNVAFNLLFSNNKIKEDEIIELRNLFIENEMDFKIRNMSNKTPAEIIKIFRYTKLSDELERQQNTIPHYKRKTEMNSISNNQNVTLNISKNEKKPLENITINWLSDSSIFKGREDTLNEIEELFKTKNRVLLHGPPVIGKTETARQFAENYSKLFNGNLIWVFAETQRSIENCFEKISEIPEIQTSDVSLFYNKFYNSNCLIIFDNAENMEAIKGFMPSPVLNDTVKVLITSQFGEWDASVGKIRIDTLKPEDAVDIISEKLGDAYNEIPQKDWFTIVKRLECIPLSVQIVSSLLYEKFRKTPIRNFDLDAFLNEFMDGTFINLEFSLAEQNLYNKTVLSSISSALNRLQMEEGLDLLCFIAYLDADYIYHEDLLLVPSINKSHDKLQEALNRLKDYSLIQFDSEENDYKIKVHRTVQLVLRKYDLYKQNGAAFKALLKIVL